ncbi:MAG: ABC transporter substrate-binding protein [Gammaproteobacteria bacterium]|nr:ABC transporter substrate-binding protein [Gammaproteobacteria bacterium]
MLAALGLVAAMAGDGAEARDPGGAGTAPIVVRDDRGVEHRFAAPPQRIVTLMPSLTETAWVLKAGPRLVGVDRFSNWPPQIAALPRLGGLEDAHIEAIARLQPDVVLASTAARSLDRLEALGLRVLRLKSNTHADVRRSLILVATLLGDPSRGRQAWTQIEHDIEAAARRVPRSMRGQRVYFEVNGGPHAAGTSSFIGETLTRLGMSNIVPPELGPFPKLNPEFVVRAAPDIIMGIDHELRDLVQRPGWDALRAVRQHRLCGFAITQHDILVRPGPRMGEAAAALADCLVGLAASTAP